MWLFGALLVVGLALIVVVAVRLVGGGVARGPERAPAPDRDRARDLLDERFARGEIGTEEYRERRRELGGG